LAGLFGWRIRQRKYRVFTVSLQSGLPRGHRAQRPTGVTFAGFHPDDALGRFVDENPDSVAIAGDGANQRQERSARLIDQRRRLSRGKLDDGRRGPPRRRKERSLVGGGQGREGHSPQGVSVSGGAARPRIRKWRAGG